jgi:hypothetical protein
MTAYTIQAPGHAGAALTMSTPAGTAGDTAPTGTHYGLLVNNVGSAAMTVVLPITPTYDGLAVASRSVSVPGTASTGSALGGWEIIPLPSAVYGVAPQSVTYSTVSNVTVAAIRIP